MTHLFMKIDANSDGTVDWWGASIGLTKRETFGPYVDLRTRIVFWPFESICPILYARLLALIEIMFSRLTRIIPCTIRKADPRAWIFFMQSAVEADFLLLYMQGRVHRLHSTATGKPFFQSQSEVDLSLGLDARRWKSQSRFSLTIDFNVSWFYFRNERKPVVKLTKSRRTATPTLRQSESAMSAFICRTTLASQHCTSVLPSFRGV